MARTHTQKAARYEKMAHVAKIEKELATAENAARSKTGPAKFHAMAKVERLKAELKKLKRSLRRRKKPAGLFDL